MHRIIFLLVALCSMQFLIAQSDTSDDSETQEATVTSDKERTLSNSPQSNQLNDAMVNLGQSSSTMVQRFDQRYQGVKGSPYWPEQWTKGSLMMKNEKWVKDVKIKYNSYSDQVVILLDGIEKAMINNMVPAFEINVEGKNYKFERIAREVAPPLIAHEYYQVIYKSDRISFYFQPRKKLIKADYEGAYKTGNPYDEFQDDLHYFIGKNDSRLKRIKLNKRAVLKAMEDRKSEVKAFMKENKIVLNQPTDLIPVLKFYNQIES
ncbi:MAG: hypothetical protein AAFY71_16830 [Bacteroidota bacterium]